MDENSEHVTDQAEIIVLDAHRKPMDFYEVLVRRGPVLMFMEELEGVARQNEALSVSRS